MPEPSKYITNKVDITNNERVSDEPTVDLPSRMIISYRPNYTLITNCRYHYGGVTTSNNAYALDVRCGTIV